MARETIMGKLFALAAGIPDLVTASRRLQHWDDTPASNQPALFFGKPVCRAVQQKGLPKQFDVSVDVLVYARSEDPNRPPCSILNPIVDAVEAALDPLPGEDAQTLGLPEISHCWIADGIETDDGVLGEQGVVIIPVHILFYSAAPRSVVAGLIDEDTGNVIFDEDTGNSLHAEAAN